MKKEDLRKRLDKTLSSAGLSYMAGTVEDVENPLDYIPLIERILNMSFRGDKLSEFAPHMVALIESIVSGVSEMQSTTHNAAEFCNLVEEFLDTKQKERELTDTESALVFSLKCLNSSMVLLEDYEEWLLDCERTNEQLSSVRDELRRVRSRLATIEEELSSFPFPSKLRVGGAVIWKEDGNICTDL